MSAQQVVRRAAKRARGEGGEDGILSEMAGLAHKQMKDCQGFIPNIWKQPLHGAQKKVVCERIVSTIMQSVCRLAKSGS